MSAGYQENQSARLAQIFLISLNMFKPTLKERKNTPCPLEHSQLSKYCTVTVTELKILVFLTHILDALKEAVS
jgi:hypothetical protein